MEPQDFSDFAVYKKRKQKNANSQNNILILFVSSFLIMLVVFTGIAKHLTPEVNVGVDEDSSAEVKESGLGVKRFIDDRLKAIQMEDQGALKASREGKKTGDEEYFSPELDERVRIPTVGLQPKVELKTKQPSTQPQTKKLEEITYVPTVLKVVVGRYSNIEQAKVAQSILQESGINVSPFVKQIGSFYTIQVGSFSTRAKAEVLTSELLRNHFPARIIEE